jgi:hypothetical protein
MIEYIFHIIDPRRDDDNQYECKDNEMNLKSYAAVLYWIGKYKFLLNSLIKRWSI